MKELKDREAIMSGDKPTRYVNTMLVKLIYYPQGTECEKRESSCSREIRNIAFSKIVILLVATKV